MAASFAYPLRGETVGFGPTESVWTDREVERLLGAALTPIRSARGGDFVDVGSPTALGGSGLLFRFLKATHAFVRLA